MSLRAVYFTVEGAAQPKGSMKAITLPGRETSVLVGSNPKGKRWDYAVAVQAFTAMRGAPLLRGALEVAATFHLPRPKSLPKKIAAHTKKPDVDKALRALLDGMTRVVYADDAQVVRVTAIKLYAIGQPKTDVHVRELEDQ